MTRKYKRKRRRRRKRNANDPRRDMSRILHQVARDRRLTAANLQSVTDQLVTTLEIITGRKDSRWSRLMRLLVHELREPKSLRVDVEHSGLKAEVSLDVDTLFPTYLGVGRADSKVHDFAFKL